MKGNRARRPAGRGKRDHHSGRKVPDSQVIRMALPPFGARTTILWIPGWRAAVPLGADLPLIQMSVGLKPSAKVSWIFAASENWSLATAMISMELRAME